MSEVQNGTREHEDLLERCKKIWKVREQTDLLNKDSFLWRDQYSPEEHHTTDYLRAWIRTRELAIRASKQVQRNQGQPTLHM